MVALADVRRWDSVGLEAVITELARSRDALVELDHALVHPASWVGASAELAAAEHERLCRRLRLLGAGASAVRRGVVAAADSIAALHDGIRVAEGLAGAHGFTVALDGTVTDVATPTVPADQAVARERSAVAAEIVDRLEQVLRRADAVDADLAAVLRRAEADGIAAGPAPAGTGPPPDGAVGDNAGWWAVLTAAERTAIIRGHPEWIGHLDGVPAADRDAANRALLRTRVAAVDAQIGSAQARRDALTADPWTALNPGAVAEVVALNGRLDTLQAQRDAYRAVSDTVGRPDRHLLLLDVERDHPRAAVAVGDIDTAEHVAVFTPGFTSTVAGSLDPYDREVSGLRDSAVDELRRADPDATATVAAVTWIGYDAPQWSDSVNPSASVASSAPAARGGVALARLLDGIDAARSDDPHLTAIGHSYGSTTTGYALQHAAGVDDAVLFGSPGASTDDVTQLNVAPGHLGVIEARGDPVADLGRFGPDPNQLDGVVGLSAAEGVTADGRALRETTGHQEYLTPGTSSHYNLASTVAGLSGQRVLGGSDDVGDGLRAGVGSVATGPVLWPR